MDNALMQYNPTPIEPQWVAQQRAAQMQGAQRNALMQQMQYEDAMQQRRAQAEQQNALMQFRQSMPSPQLQASQQALAGGGGPTVANAARMPEVDPRLQALHGAMRAGAMSPLDYLKEANPAPKFTTVAPGASLVNERTGKPMFTAPIEPKASDVPAAVREYEYAKQQGFPGSFEQWTTSQKKAGATNLNVNTAEKGFLQSLSGKVGDDVMNASEAARGAQKSLSTVASMRQALASSKAITGTAANQRTALAQIGYTLGIGPADSPETLAKTREMMMGFGQLELDAAAQMKGQGQITESERAILRKAAAGDITMTVPEIETVLNVSERRAKTQIARNKRNVDTLKKMPNAASLVDFLDANGESSDNFKMPTAEDIAAEARRRASARGGK